MKPAFNKILAYEKVQFEFSQFMIISSYKRSRILF